MAARTAVAVGLSSAAGSPPPTPGATRAHLVAEPLLTSTTSGYWDGSAAAIDTSGVAQIAHTTAGVALLGPSLHVASNGKVRLRSTSSRLVWQPVVIVPACF